MVVEDMVVALASTDGGGDGATGLGAAGCIGACVGG